jgi:uncharacterized LabA/DUF88 family protein
MPADVPTSPRKRVMVFIDGSNFYHAVRSKYGRASVDFRRLVSEIVGPERELVRAYYYNAPVNAAEVPEQYKRQQRFFSALRRLGYFEVKLGRLERRPHGIVEKGVDVFLATDMVAMGLRDRYDVAALVTGDGDFSYAVQVVKDAGKHVELAFPRCRGLANALLDTCDSYVELKEGNQLHFPT